MKNRIVATAAFVAALGLHQGALAIPITLDFNPGSGAYSSMLTGNNNTYTEKGFTFQTPLVSGNHFDSGLNVGLNCCPNTLIFHEAASNSVNNLITLSFGGAAFDFINFMLVDDPGIRAFNPLINPQMLLTASDGRTFLTPTAGGIGFMGLIAPNWQNITSVTFDITSNTTTVGNVVIDDVLLNSQATIPVPEPATFALFGIGLLGLGYLVRRRRSAVHTLEVIGRHRQAARR